jgi:hypothetical protein
MVSIYDKNFRAFPLTGEEIEVLRDKKLKFRNAGHAQEERGWIKLYPENSSNCNSVRKVFV